jgi:polysaccharide export outer membrane protein
MKDAFKSLSWLVGGVGVILLLGALGCQGPRYSFTESTETNELAMVTAGAATNLPPGAPSTPDTLRPGDKIIITYSGNPNAPAQPHEEQIREDGNIKPTLLGREVMAAGKTIGQLQDELHKLYVPAFFQSLTVTVRSEERYFFVGGQVRAPGAKVYLSEMTVLKAIQAAGDFTDFANRRKVEVRRKDGTRVVVDCKRVIRHPEEDPPIFPGDLVHVPQRW